jgi:hypothetical protein
VLPFPYNFDPEELEIFPSEIYSDPFVVYHGTSAYHSPEIESKGLIPGRAPYNLQSARLLVNLLRNPIIAPLDTEKLADIIEHYIDNPLRISFGYVSTACETFASGPAKGGQSLVKVRQAETTLQQAKTTGLSIELPVDVQELFNTAANIARHPGVIYAVKLPPNLIGITEEFGVIYSSLALFPGALVGKIILPEPSPHQPIPPGRIKQKTFEKLAKRGFLGHIFNQRDAELDLEESP